MKTVGCRCTLASTVSAGLSSGCGWLGQGWETEVQIKEMANMCTVQLTCVYVWEYVCGCVYVVQGWRIDNKPKMKRGIVVAVFPWCPFPNTHLFIISNCFPLQGHRGRSQPLPPLADRRYAPWTGWQFITGLKQTVIHAHFLKWQTKDTKVKKMFKLYIFGLWNGTINTLMWRMDQLIVCSFRAVANSHNCSESLPTSSQLHRPFSVL